MLKIELWSNTAPLSQPDFLLQWSAIQTEKMGTKCILTKSADGWRATWKQKNVWAKTTNKHHKTLENDKQTTEKENGKKPNRKRNLIPCQTVETGRQQKITVHRFNMFIVVLKIRTQRN